MLSVSLPFVLASQGPFGPTPLTCLLLPLMLLGPFLLLGLTAMSLLCAEPVSGWLLGIKLPGTLFLAYVIWSGESTTRLSGFWQMWRGAGIAVLVLLPLVLLKEAAKRGWLRSPGRRRKRRRPVPPVESSTEEEQ